MYLLRNIFYLTFVVTFVGKTLAVSVTSNSIKNQKIYGIEFSGDSRGFYGDENAVQSISAQEYITAAFFVTEINIVTQGTGLLRIYHSRPLAVGELKKTLGETANTLGLSSGNSIIQSPLSPQVQAIVDSASSATVKSRAVVKEYPVATHAHTIEFRIANLSELLKLYDELKKHWLKEPAFFEAGQIIDNGNTITTEKEMKLRSLGGTLFKVEDH